MLRKETMKPSEFLREATKFNWTQGCYARDITGESVDIRVGVYFCSVGRLMKVGASCLNPTVFSEAYGYLEKVLGPIDIVSWNDASDRTWEGVDTVFLKAAELAESEGR